MEPNVTTVALSVNFRVESKTDPAIAGEVREILGGVGLHVKVASRASYENGVAQVYAEVYVPTNMTVDTVQPLAQAAIEKAYPGSVPETTEEQQEQAEVTELIEEENPGIGE